MDNDAILSIENATEQWALVKDYYDLDFDRPLELCESDKEREEVERGVQYLKQFEKDLIKKISMGKIEVENMDGRVFIIQHLSFDYIKTYKDKKIKYKPINGFAKIEMHKAPKEMKTYVLLAKLAGVEVEKILKLEAADLSLAETLGQLFLAL